MNYRLLAKFLCINLCFINTFLFCEEPYFLNKKYLISLDDFRSYNIEAIKQKYEQTFNNIQYLLFPAKETKKLVIIFSGAIVNKYFIWSWFWDAKEEWKETSYLFLKDDTTSWYLGSKTKPLDGEYSAIINKIIADFKISKNKVITMGPSMGGYAALYYAIKLELKAAIAFDPQIDKKHFEDIGPQWKINNNYEEMRIINLTDMVLESKNMPNVYLQYSNNLQDKANAIRFIDALKARNENFTIIRNVNVTKHAGFIPSLEFIQNTIDYFFKI